MKILCVIDSLGSGGAQKQLVELAICLKEMGNDVSFLTYHPHQFYKPLLKENNISDLCIPELNYLKRIFKMRKYIRSGNFNVVVSFLEGSNFICEVSGLPYRNWNLIVGERSSNPNIKRSVKLKFYRWMHFLASFVVSNSNSNLEIVRKINPFLSSQKCHVIYNMIDFGKWVVDCPYTPFNNGQLHIFVAASHQKLKNLDGLIKAVNLLDMEERLKLRITWYGDHGFDSSFNEGKQLILKYQLSDVFFFHDAILDIKYIMQQADVVGLFSKYEGLPNSICEGMALGKPILATYVSDLPLFIDESCGILCYQNNPENIAFGIRKFLRMDSHQLLYMGINAKNKAKSLFSKENILNDYWYLITK